MNPSDIGEEARSKPSAIEVTSNVVDKLTDVLNVGRVLSIGVPGFVAAFGVLLLLARISPLEIPRKSLPAGLAVADSTARQVPGIPDSMLSAEQDAVSGVLGNRSFAESAAALGLSLPLLHARDSLRLAGLPTVYYEQLPHDRIPLQVQELKVASDFRTVLRNWYIWFIVAIMMGCVIGVGGYWHMMKRLDLRNTWQKLLDEALPRLQKVKDEPIPTDDAARKVAAVDRKAEAREVERLVSRRPRYWFGLRKRIEEMEEFWTEPKDELRAVQRQELGAERGTFDAKYSWTNLHVPLMGSGPTPGMTCWDYLMKEYWRFVEFAVNFPVALFICMLFLGIYFFSLRWPPYGFFGWLGIALFGLAILGFALLHYWTDSVVLNSYDQYKQAANGTVAGLMLFTPQDGKDAGCQLRRLGVTDDEFGVVRKLYLAQFKGHLGLSEPGWVAPPVRAAASRTDKTKSHDGRAEAD